MRQTEGVTDAEPEPHRDGAEVDRRGAESVIPQIGFGTYRMGGYVCYDAVAAALDEGYRHIDTAMAYENEAVVGRAIERSSVDRDDVFLTTKVKGYPEFLEYDALIAAVESCLERLGTDYLDLLLIHWWNSAADMTETFAATDELIERGLVDHVGVSNFSVDQLRRAISVSDAPILTNQVLYHPYFDQAEMLNFCRREDVTLTAYSPLAEGWVTEDETLASIGKRYRKSAAQVALRWAVQQDNVVAIPKTSSRDRARENLDVFDFELSDREMYRIGELEGPFRYRLFAEDGPVNRFRAFVGPHVPKQVRERLPI